MTRRERLIEALQSAPHDLQRLLRPLDEAQARQRGNPTQWSVADAVAHLAAVEERFLHRFRRVVAEELPTVPFIHPEETYDLSPATAALVQQFTERRAATVAFLQGLSQNDWARRVLREDEQIPSTLRDQVQLLVEHDSEHLAQIVTLRGSLAG